MWKDLIIGPDGKLSARRILGNICMVAGVVMTCIADKPGPTLYELIFSVRGIILCVIGLILWGVVTAQMLRDIAGKGKGDAK